MHAIEEFDVLFIGELSLSVKLRYVNYDRSDNRWQCKEKEDHAQVQKESCSSEGLQVDEVDWHKELPCQREDEKDNVSRWVAIVIAKP